MIIFLLLIIVFALFLLKTKIKIKSKAAIPSQMSLANYCKNGYYEIPGEQICSRAPLCGGRSYEDVAALPAPDANTCISGIDGQRKACHGMVPVCCYEIVRTGDPLMCVGYWERLWCHPDQCRQIDLEKGRVCNSGNPGICQCGHAFETWCQGADSPDPPIPVEQRLKITTATPVPPSPTITPTTPSATPTFSCPFQGTVSVRDNNNQLILTSGFAVHSIATKSGQTVPNSEKTNSITNGTFSTSFQVPDSYKDSRASVTLIYPTAYQIAGRWCSNSGNGGCPDISGTGATISGFNIVCGVNCDYGWRLVIPSLTPTVTSAPTPTSTPKPTNPPIPTSTSGPTPTLTPAPTNPPTPTSTSGPTPTSIPTINVNLNLKLKFQGVLKKPDSQNNRLNVKIGLARRSTGSSEPAAFKTAEFTADDNRIWSGQVRFDHLLPSQNYAVYIKGGKHLQRKICSSSPKENLPASYQCQNDIGNIVLTESKEYSYDFSNIYLLSGDLPDQDGIINSYDASLIRNNLGKTDSNTLLKADVNFDGIVDSQDFSIVLSSLAIKYRDDQ